MAMLAKCLVGTTSTSSPIFFEEDGGFGTTWKSSLPALVSRPAEVVNAPLIRPFLGPGDEVFAQRVLADVGQLVLIFDAIAKAMMKGFALP